MWKKPERKDEKQDRAGVRRGETSLRGGNLKKEYPNRRVRIWETGRFKDAVLRLDNGEVLLRFVMGKMMRGKPGIIGQTDWLTHESTVYLGNIWQIHCKKNDYISMLAENSEKDQLMVMVVSETINHEILHQGIANASDFDNISIYTSCEEGAVPLEEKLVEKLTCNPKIECFIDDL